MWPDGSIRTNCRFVRSLLLVVVFSCTAHSFLQTAFSRGRLSDSPFVTLTQGSLEMASYVAPRGQALEVLAASTSSMMLLSRVTSATEMEELAKGVKKRATSNTPFTDDEIAALMASIKHVLPSEDESALDFDKLKLLVKEVGHLTHKDWEKTMEYSARLEELLLPTATPETGSKIDNIKTSLLFRSIFERVLRDGHWKEAREYSTTLPTHEEPWAVVVTGLNGIRKTTTIYQEWYKTLLSEALVVPDGGQPPSDPSHLPVGSNSFFRQLDHMIAVLANVQFVTLYTISVGSSDASKAQAVKAYSQYKDAVFARYRTLSEMVGIILCREAQRSKVNIMVETSGRDISMYKYVNAVFGDTNYRKLALHFTINDLSFAEQSVDIRMADEIKRGKEALLGDEDESMNATVKRVVDVNAGGPYGSAVLKGVQAESTRVWNEVWGKDDGDGNSANSPSVSDGWFQACFEICGDDSKSWTAESILPDGKKGSKFKFPLRT